MDPSLSLSSITQQGSSYSRINSEYLPRSRNMIPRDHSPFKNDSIPELRDLSQERTMSKIRSRNNSQSKSPKNTINDLEQNWKRIKEEHLNFENNIGSGLNTEEGEKILDLSKYNEKRKNCKILKKLIPHSKINLEHFHHQVDSFSQQNTPERNFRGRRELSETRKDNNDDSKENNHFKEILEKYSNIHKRNVEIDLRICGNNNKSNLSNQKEPNKNNSKIKNLEKNVDKINDKALKLQNAEDYYTKMLEKNKYFLDSNERTPTEKNNFEKLNVLNEKINEKIKKINTAKINLQEDEEIPNETKDNDSKIFNIQQSPQCFSKKQTFGIINENKARDKNNRSFVNIEGIMGKYKSSTPMKENANLGIFEMLRTSSNNFDDRLIKDSLYKNCKIEKNDQNMKLNMNAINNDGKFKLSLVNDDNKNNFEIKKGTLANKTKTMKYSSKLNKKSAVK